MYLVHVYIDDLLIASPNGDEHIQHFIPLFKTMSDKQVVVNPDKRGIDKTEPTFLGHEII